MRPDTLLSSMPAPSVVPAAAAPAPAQGPSIFPANIPPATVRFTEQYGFPGSIPSASVSAPQLTVPSVFSGGISSLPGMSNGAMMAGMSPNQSNMVDQYLRSRNMVGFA
jgi:hypothetical protein